MKKSAAFPHVREVFPVFDESEDLTRQNDEKHVNSKNTQSFLSQIIFVMLIY